MNEDSRLVEELECRLTDVGLDTWHGEGEVLGVVECSGFDARLPNCPECGYRTYRMMSIPHGVLRQVFPDHNNLPRAIDLICCWWCAASIEGWYTGNLDSGIKFRRWSVYRKGWPAYDDFPEYFPRFEVSLRRQLPLEREIRQMYLRDIPSRVTDPLWKGVLPNDPLWPPSHQVGGMPLLWWVPERANCMGCGGPMTMLATVPETVPGSEGYNGAGDVLVWYEVCTHCWMIRSDHQYC